MVCEKSGSQSEVRYWLACCACERRGSRPCVRFFEGIGGVDFPGLMAAFIMAGAAWAAVKQFSPLAAAYSMASMELAIQADKLKSVPENDWPLVAADAEEAISREHTMWLASRTGKQPKV